jgi:hypothetical protein
MHVKRLFGSMGLVALLVMMVVMAGVVIVRVEAAPNGISERAVISEAYSWLGVPYKFGGGHDSDPYKGTRGVDCSSLVRQIYMRASGWRAYYKDRTAEEIRRASYPVWPPRPGDVIIFIDKRTGTCTHVGIYIGPSSYGYWDAYFISAVYRIGSDYPMKVELDRLYFSKHGTGIWYKYFYIYFARYNPDSWNS